MSDPCRFCGHLDASDAEQARCLCTAYGCPCAERIQDRIPNVIPNVPKRPFAVFVRWAGEWECIWYDEARNHADAIRRAALAYTERPLFDDEAQIITVQMTDLTDDLPVLRSYNVHLDIRPA